MVYTSGQELCTMIRHVLTAVVAICLFFFGSQFLSLRRNIRAARDSELKYVIAPLSQFWRTWRAGYEPFQHAANDTFIIVSPGGNTLWTCSPEVITQLTERPTEFTKPVGMLQMLNNFGPTITAAEGEEYRRYRKIAIPAFNEETHRAVWRESIRQAEMMLEYWDRRDGLVKDVGADCHRYALHILSKALFDMELDWETIAHRPRGHELSFSEALTGALKHNATLFMVPRALLSISPLQTHKDAIQSYNEFRQYMKEIVDQVKRDLKTRSTTSEGNILESFVKASQAQDESRIPTSAVFGNLFIFTLAGHETSANAMNFALALLAAFPDFQKDLQAEIQMVLGGRDPSTWTYPDDFSRLMDGHIGALLNETLRLYTVLPFIPKVTERAQTLTVNGEKHVLAPKTLCLINTSAIHRHPKYWPRGSIKRSDVAPFPVSSFNPKRWLSKEAPAEPGSFIPFSEGFRSCIGSRFARIEFVGALATICSQYDVELDGHGEVALRDMDRRLSAGVGFEMALKLIDPVALRFVRRK